MQRFILIIIAALLIGFTYWVASSDLYASSIIGFSSWVVIYSFAVWVSTKKPIPLHERTEPDFVVPVQQEFELEQPEEVITVKYDKRKFTANQIRRIIELNAVREKNNDGLCTRDPDYISAQELTDELNAEFHLNKSRWTYARIWNQPTQ